MKLFIRMILSIMGFLTVAFAVAATLIVRHSVRSSERAFHKLKTYHNGGYHYTS